MACCFFLLEHVEPSVTLLGLERTQHFATLPGWTGRLKFPGHILPDRTYTGPPFLVKQSVERNQMRQKYLHFSRSWYFVVPSCPGANLLHP